MVEKKTIFFLLRQVAAIAIAAFACIVIAFFAIPHLPVSDKHNFPMLLRAQMTLDHEQGMHTEKDSNLHNLLLMGSSVVERDIDDRYLDTLLLQQHIPYFSINAGAGGAFANENLATFRAMLERGLHPDRVIYGTFLQEFNGKFVLHNGINDSSLPPLKNKSLWNALRYGPSSLSSILDGSNFHIYIFAINNAFNTVQDPNILQRLSFGENMYERDSSYQFSSAYLKDLKTIYAICRERHIPFALFNSPVRPKIESYADLPYLHKTEAYSAIERFAIDENIPIWNFDTPGNFTDGDFLDTYHLNARGTHKLTKFLFDKIAIWNTGIIEQDVVNNSVDSIRGEVKDSLVRTVFHF